MSQGAEIKSSSLRATEGQRKCQSCQKEFVVEVEDFEFYEKISDKNSEVKVPAPTWCPECRVKRRMNFYNVSTLYKRKCDKCQSNIIAIYPEDVKFPVYCPKCWWADDWDATEYAKEYDINKSFLEQFKELFRQVPRVALEVDYQRNINSPYANACGPLKNCYMAFLVTIEGENAGYIKFVTNVRDSMDLTRVSDTEESYALFQCARLYGSTFSRECSDSVNIHFSKNLKNCQNCFGCVNLRNKSYCIFNEQYSKTDYEAEIKKIARGSFAFQQKIIEKAEQLFLKFPNKFIHGMNNDDVKGDYIYNSKNVKQSFEIVNGENLKYCHMLETGIAKDCYDYTNWGQNASNIYEVCRSGDGISNIKFTEGAWLAHNIEYSDNPISSNNLFGCVNIRNKQYHILNKQYTKEKYFEMVEKIKKQMNEMPYVDKQGREYKYGEFFPPELSPFAYNETIAQEYFPLTKEEAIKQGYKWKDPEKRNYQTTIEAKDLPDSIKDVNDSILKEVIGCATIEEDREAIGCTTAFKIIPKELEFYKKMNLPLPRYCPNCRHHQRLKNRNPLKLYKRTCQKEGCNTEFETTYAPDRPEIVYCEKCYQNEVA